jgi:RNA polymerase sigma-70 factor (ECF subfamily)
VRGPSASSSSPGDHELVERLRAGDEAAFAELVDRYDGPLRRLALSFVKTPATAEDVVQETWEGVIKGIDRFEERSSLKTWIFRILVNRARTRGVKDSRVLPFSSLGDEDVGPAEAPSSFDECGMWRSRPAELATDPDHQLLAGELRAQLAAAVEELPDRQRAVLTLRDIVGLPADEVASLLEISDGNQRLLLHRARTRVRAALAGYVAAEEAGR